MKRFIASLIFLSISVAIFAQADPRDTPFDEVINGVTYKLQVVKRGNPIAYTTELKIVKSNYQVENLTVPTGIISHDFGSGAEDYTITTIGEDAWRDNASLRTLTIPAGIQYLEYRVFNNCDNLTQVTFEGNPTNLGIGMFEGCDKLTTVTLADNCSFIGEYMFKNCPALTTVTFPGNSTPGFVIPNTVTEIGQQAFEECPRLESFNVPANVALIGTRAFAGCKNLTSLTVDDGNTNYKDIDHCIIRTTDHAVNPTQMAKTITHGCSTSIIPTDANEVTSIGDYAFYDCYSLKTTDANHIKNIPENITAIGIEAFYGCSDDGFTEVHIPNTVTGENLKDGAFWNCKKLSVATLSTEITKISNSLFCGCVSLPNITIPAKVTTIGNNAFQFCESMSDVTFAADPNNNITSIGNNAFQNCIFTTFDMPTSLTYLGSASFAGCKELGSIIIPDGVTQILNNTFQDCSKMTMVKMGYQVTSIGNEAFWRCDNLTDVLSKNADAEYGQDNNAMAGYGPILPATLTKIGNEAFFHVTGLKKLYIPKTYSNSGAGAFGYETFAENPNLILYFYCGDLVTPGTRLNETFTVKKKVDNQDTELTNNAAYNFDPTKKNRAYSVWHPSFVKHNGTIYCATCKTVFDDNEYRANKYLLVDEDMNTVTPVANESRYSRTFNTANQWQPLVVPFTSKRSQWKDIQTIDGNTYDFNDIEIAYLYNYYETDAENDAGKISYIVLDNNNDDIIAGLPYIIRKKTPGAINVTGITLDAPNHSGVITSSHAPSATPTAVSCSSTEKIYTMSPVYANTSIAINDANRQGYYFLSSGQLVYTTGSSYNMKPLRWNMTVTAKDYDGSTGSYQDPASFTKSYTFVEEDSELSAIEHAEKAEKERIASRYYNISGIQVNGLQKGLNIIRMSDGTVRKVVKK